jgi:prepilin-type processing-associated H-X9-DG protein
VATAEKPAFHLLLLLCTLNGNVLFFDSHVGYYQATPDKKDCQHGENWTITYSDA